MSPLREGVHDVGMWSLLGENSRQQRMALPAQYGTSSRFRTSRLTGAASIPHGGTALAKAPSSLRCAYFRLPPDGEGPPQVGWTDTHPHPEGDRVPSGQANGQQGADERAQARDLHHCRGIRAAMTQPCCVRQSLW
jgi:hypothetical protein